MELSAPRLYNALSLHIVESSWWTLSNATLQHAQGGYVSGRAYLTGQTEPKRRFSQIFADSHLLLENDAIGKRRPSQKTADSRRNPQKSGTRRKPQKTGARRNPLIGVCPLGLLPLSAAPMFLSSLAWPSYIIGGEQGRNATVAFCTVRCCLSVSPGLAGADFLPAMFVLIMSSERFLYFLQLARREAYVAGQSSLRNELERCNA